MTFFDYSCHVKASERFGIRDDEDGKQKILDSVGNSSESQCPKTAKELPAFVDYDEPEKWNAIVESNYRKDFNFIPVDNCVPYNDECGNERSRCDAIVWTEHTVIFVELKDQARNWFEDAVDQLKSTISHFKNAENIDEFKFKRAYICNKSHPSFNYQFKIRMQQFFRETGVSLHPEILIKNVR